MRSYAVVALIDPLDIGTTISRRAWPAHVTLASNFTAAAAADRIIEAVAEAAPAGEPLSFRIGEEAMFGTNQDARVRLVDSKQAISAHRRLTDQLESLPGFIAEEPAYWRDGYRPHLTLSPSVTPTEGDRIAANLVAVVEIFDTDAKVVALCAREPHLTRP
jgi:2'-5' RNA ligase